MAMGSREYPDLKIAARTSSAARAARPSLHVRPRIARIAAANPPPPCPPPCLRTEKCRLFLKNYTEPDAAVTGKGKYEAILVRTAQRRAIRRRTLQACSTKLLNWAKIPTALPLVSYRSLAVWRPPHPPPPAARGRQPHAQGARD